MKGLELTVSLSVRLVLLVINVVRKQRAAKQTGTGTECQTTGHAHTAAAGPLAACHRLSAAVTPVALLLHWIPAAAAVASILRLLRGVVAALLRGIVSSLLGRVPLLGVSPILRLLRRVASGAAVLSLAAASGLSLAQQLAKEAAALAALLHARGQLLGEGGLRLLVLLLLQAVAGGHGGVGAAVALVFLGLELAGEALVFGHGVGGAAGAAGARWLRGRAVVLVGVRLRVDGVWRGAVARSRGVARGRAVWVLTVRGRRRGQGWFGGLFPLGLLCVEVYVEPGGRRGVSLVRFASFEGIGDVPFFVLVVPAGGPAGRDFWGLGRRGAGRGSEVVGHVY